MKATITMAAAALALSLLAPVTATAGPTDALGNLPTAVLDELNALVPDEGADWAGFVPFNPCAEIEANQGKLDVCASASLR
ncbi:MAG: hypothetical protein CMM46_06900 [Rhodospirillaceae bacterium]|nr:hypothetical protein [Rhodospirillaceae bacterium]